MCVSEYLSFFFMTQKYPSPQHVFAALFIQSSVGKHLSGFGLVAIVNKAALNRDAEPIDSPL